jgi:hypothetical protein
MGATDDGERVTFRKVRNLMIFLALGLLMQVVIFDGLANHGITVGLLPLTMILLSFVSVGLIFIASA